MKHFLSNYYVSLANVQCAYKKSENKKQDHQIEERYILPILSYASLIWSPSYKSKIQELKRAQKRFVRLLFGPGNYTNNLAKIGLKSLEEQRKIDDLVLVHKIYQQKLPLQALITPEENQTNI
jgi:hypothetical protein